LNQSEELLLKENIRRREERREILKAKFNYLAVKLWSFRLFISNLFYLHVIFDPILYIELISPSNSLTLTTYVSPIISVYDIE
jgi:hypothetical protein